jgi:undecaprenyl-diphosphatase
MRSQANRHGARAIAVLVAAILASAIAPPAGALDIDAALEVPGFDRWAMAAYLKPLDTASEALTFASMALPAALILEAPKEDWGSIGAMYAGSLFLSWGLKSLGKALVSRQRPYMYFDMASGGEAESGEGDQSFPSGHAALAFAGATFFSSMLRRYCDDPSRRIPLIAASFACAAGASVLRVASGNHFPSDVAAGAAIGILSGLAVPWLEARISEK